MDFILSSFESIYGKPFQARVGAARPDLEQEICVENYVKRLSQTLLTMQLLRLENLYFGIEWLSIS